MYTFKTYNVIYILKSTLILMRLKKKKPHTHELIPKHIIMFKLGSFNT